MKLAVILLFGVIALTAGAKYHKHDSEKSVSQIATFKDEVEKPGFLDGLRESMEQKVKELAQKNIKFLEDQLASLTAKFVAKLTRLAQYSLVKTEMIATNARTEFLLSNDKNALPCFNEHREEFDNVQSFARAGVENCTIGGTLELKVVQNNVSEHINAIKKEVDNINGILKDCIKIFHPISTTKCIFKNVSNIMTSIKTVVASAMDAIKTGGENLKKVGSDTKVCIQANAQNAELKTKAVIDDIKRCIEKAHNATTQTPPTEAPATEKPTTQKPATEKPATEKPATEKPATEKPATEKPATEKPATEKPATEKPTTQKPATEEPTTQKPATEEPTTQKPATEEPTTEKPAEKPSSEVEDKYSPAHN